MGNTNMQVHTPTPDAKLCKIDWPNEIYAGTPDHMQIYAKSTDLI